MDNEMDSWTMLPRDIREHQRALEKVRDTQYEISREIRKRNFTIDEALEEGYKNMADDSDLHKRVVRIENKLFEMTQSYSGLRKKMNESLIDASDQYYSQKVTEQTIANEQNTRAHKAVKRSYQLIGCGLGGQIITAPVVGVVTQSISLVIALGLVSIVLYVVGYLLMPAQQRRDEVTERKIRADNEWLLAAEARNRREIEL